LKQGILFASYFITLLGDNRNQSFAIYLPPDFFNSIDPKQSLVVGDRDGKKSF
jgi:hypothetical protein